MTSDLFSQKAECLQEFPAVNQALFGCPPGDPLPESQCLSGDHGLVAVRYHTGHQMQISRFAKSRLQKC